jgi:hypothetical protein
MVAKKTNGYRNHTADGSYWTVRKHSHTFWVLRLRSETYEQLEVWGGYSRAGAAAHLPDFQAVSEMTESLRGALRRALDKVGLGALPPNAPVSASEAPANLAVADDE